MKLILSLFLLTLVCACTVRDQAYYNSAGGGVGTAVQDLGNGWYRVAGNGPLRATEKEVGETLPSVLQAMFLRAAQLCVEKGKEAFELGAMAPMKVQRTNRYGANLGQWADITIDVRPVDGAEAAQSGKRVFSAVKILADGGAGFVPPTGPDSAPGYNQRQRTQ